MTTAAPQSITDQPAPPTGTRGLIRAGYELTKPRITRMVAVTAGVGFVLGAAGQVWEVRDLVIRAIGCLIGTAVSSAGANALNMWWERTRDAQMPRTMTRPLPQGRLSPLPAAIIGVACSVLGVGILGLTVGLLPAIIAAFTVLVYVLCYTPLKPITTLNTIVGAIPGALPPLIGWAGAIAGNKLSGNELAAALAHPGGWSLFLIMFVWQVPHVLALAWMYKDDYAKGGYRMLPIVDESGERTARTILLWAVALVPVSVAPALLLSDRLGWLTGAAAGISGVVFLRLCWKVWIKRTREAARAAFLGSVIHLPVLLLAMTADAVAHALISNVR